MTKPLRTPSARPELVVDPRAYSLYEWPGHTRVGIVGPFGRERCQYVLPVNESPAQWLDPHQALVDNGGSYLADPDGNLIGEPGVWVARMLTARWTEDTRRLAG